MYCLKMKTKRLKRVSVLELKIPHTLDQPGIFYNGIMINTNVHTTIYYRHDNRSVEKEKRGKAGENQFRRDQQLNVEVRYDRLTIFLHTCTV